MLPEERAHFLASIAVAKNVSFDPLMGRLGGVVKPDELLATMLRRFSDAAASLVEALFLPYGGRSQRGRASFRPAEIAGRQTTWRHDDT